MRTPFASLGLAPVSFCIVAFCGCAGATRLPTKTETPRGAEIQQNDVDMTFLQAGTTRRDEVFNRLGRIDTGFRNPRMFWGRWSDSKWGSWVIIPTPTGVGGGGRNWRVHNVLVDFNDSGTVQTHELVDDEKDLERKLRELLAQAPPLDLTQPLQIKLTPHSEGWALEGPKELTLDKEAMQYGSVKISTLNVVRISYERFYGNPRLDSICHSLHLAEKTPVGKKFLFCTNATGLATLLHYLQQSGQKNLRWE